jgi:hypothetical protein
MKIAFPLLGLSLGFTALLGADYSVRTLDEDRQPIVAASVEAVFSRINDPRTSSLRTFEGKTSADGTFRWEAGEDMCLVRLRARKSGYFEADADHRHGLGVVPSIQEQVITLPRENRGVGLCYKDILLRTDSGTLPSKTWVGFDFALGEAVPPWGNGQTADVKIWNEGEQVGWTQEAETIEIFKKDPELARLSEAQFADLYGSFRGVTRIRCDDQGAGVVRSAFFWPYSPLKMPPVAPQDNYAASMELPYRTLPYPTARDDYVGFYLRLRPKLGPDGKVISAHYAKILGPIRSGYGWVAFRYYYNPVVDDRRLVMDLEKNLLKPTVGTAERELHRYRPYER